MLVRCNLPCRLSDGQTDASLDPESNEAICNSCGDILPNISDFTKLSMKSNGDILRKKANKAFSFACQTCDKKVRVFSEENALIGDPCISDNDCSFNLTDSMISAIKIFQEN